jgi:hypothetical protein
MILSVDKSVAIVITTIADGGFVANFRPLLEHGGNNIRLIIVGDLTTPPQCETAVQRIRADGLNCCYLGPDRQKELLHAVPDLAAHIPWRSDNRRNVGFLEAWRQGSDVIISMDDDNIPGHPADFIDQYRAVGTPRRLKLVETRNRWINVCSLLECRSGWDRQPISVYARGFPLSRRGTDGTTVSDAEMNGDVVMQVGLWSGEPDVDAATRSATAVQSAGLRIADPVIVPTGARLPISSQNVAVARRLVPAWWYVRMGTCVRGLRMDRFGDMFQGYFATIAAEALGDAVAVGPPLVAHRRNPHRLLADLAAELPGMALLETLLPFIEDAPAPAQTYEDAYLQIAARLQEAARRASDELWGEALRSWGEETAKVMEAWTAACRALDTATNDVRSRQGSVRSSRSVAESTAPE